VLNEDKDEIYICEICVMVYVTKLIELERIMTDWNELETPALLLAIGEELSKENVVHMDLARDML